MKISFPAVFAAAFASSSFVDHDSVPLSSNRGCGDVFGGSPPRTARANAARAANAAVARRDRMGPSVRPTALRRRQGSGEFRAARVLVSSRGRRLRNGQERPREVPMRRSEQVLGDRIVVVRGHRVVLDADLARVYGVTTARLNEAVKRNRARFPADFAFRLTVREARNLMSQFATSSVQTMTDQQLGANATVRRRAGHGGHRKPSWAFTEHGALMAANVLRSARAVRMSVHVVRAFVRMRERLAADASILKRLAEIDATLLSHDDALRKTWTALRPLLTPPADPPRRRIGFDVRDTGSWPAPRAR